jgi:hypothetical protein
LLRCRGRRRKIATRGTSISEDYSEFTKKEIYLAMQTFFGPEKKRSASRAPSIVLVKKPN